MFPTKRAGVVSETLEPKGLKRLIEQHEGARSWDESEPDEMTEVSSPGLPRAACVVGEEVLKLETAEQIMNCPDPIFYSSREDLRIQLEERYPAPHEYLTNIITVRDLKLSKYAVERLVISSVPIFYPSRHLELTIEEIRDFVISQGNWIRCENYGNGCFSVGEETLAIKGLIIDRIWLDSAGNASYTKRPPLRGTHTKFLGLIYNRRRANNWLKQHSRGMTGLSKPRRITSKDLLSALVRHLCFYLQQILSNLSEEVIVIRRHSFKSFDQGVRQILALLRLSEKLSNIAHRESKYFFRKSESYIKTIDQLLEREKQLKCYAQHQSEATQTAIEELIKSLKKEKSKSKKISETHLCAL